MNLSTLFLLLPIFFGKCFQLIYPIFIPLGEFAFEELAREFPAQAAEIRAVFLAAFEDIAAVFPHFNALSAVFAAALTAAVVKKSAHFAVAAAGGYT